METEMSNSETNTNFRGDTVATRQGREFEREESVFLQGAQAEAGCQGRWISVRGSYPQRRHLLGGRVSEPDEERVLRAADAVA